MSIIGSPIMLGGGGGENPNLLIGTTWAAGYVQSNGSINSPDATRKEIYSDYIDVGSGSNRVFLFVTITDETSPWLGVGFYDSNKASASPTRQTAEISYQTPDGQYMNYLVYNLTNTSIRYIRFSYRNYGSTTNKAGAFLVRDIGTDIGIPPLG